MWKLNWIVLVTNPYASCSAADLDETTVQLLRQSSERTFGDLTSVWPRDMLCTAAELAVYAFRNVSTADTATYMTCCLLCFLQKDIHNEYVAQELKREWNEYKHTVVSDVINSRGIRPGYGKWGKHWWTQCNSWNIETYSNHDTDAFWVVMKA